MSPRMLAAEFADREQAALAEADRKFHDVHGAELDWSDLEVETYRRLIEKVHAVFHADEIGVAA